MKNTTVVAAIIVVLIVILGAVFVYLNKAPKENNGVIIENINGVYQVSPGDALPVPTSPPDVTPPTFPPAN